MCLFFFFSPALSWAQENVCFPPERPFVPAEIESAREYRDLIYNDFQLYFSELGSYLQCLDEERGRAFREGQEVTESYRRFFNQVVSVD